MNLRKEWFEYVSKIRKKTARLTKKPCSHREAMKLAADTWPAEKVKLQNKARRAERKAAKLTKKPASEKSTEPTILNQ